MVNKLNADGSFYEGDYKGNMPDGNGYFSWTDGTVYDGKSLTSILIIPISFLCYFILLLARIQYIIRNNENTKQLFINYT